MNVDEISWMIEGSVEILYVGIPDISPLLVSALRFAALLSAPAIGAAARKRWKIDNYNLCIRVGTSGINSLG